MKGFTFTLAIGYVAIAASVISLIKGEIIMSGIFLILAELLLARAEKQDDKAISSSFDVTKHLESTLVPKKRGRPKGSKSK